MDKLKPIEEVNCVVVDYGTFLSLAERLAEKMKTVYYYSPYEEEYQDVRECVIGKGLDKVKRLDDFLEPDVLKTIDLFVFPDIGYGGLQRHLRDMGKAVWGSMGASDIELYRTKFVDILKKVGLPLVKSEKIHGLTNLGDYLKGVRDKWIKVDRYRDNMETWHHIDYKNSRQMLASLAISFGGYKEDIDFVVQDNIESDIETGYDGWCVDGEFPDRSYQGYEKKNELYLGSLLTEKEIAEPIKLVNEKMAPILKEYGYRNWWATEIRVKDKTPYFIDPTPRIPGQTGEHQFMNCENLEEVIWKGAHGELVSPKFKKNFAAEATLHYSGEASDDAVLRPWIEIDFPKEVLPWLKPYKYCKSHGVYNFVPRNNDEIGVMIGLGDSVEGAMDDLDKHIEMLKDLPIHAETDGFEDLLKSIKEAESKGIKFSGDAKTSSQTETKKPGLTQKKTSYDFDGVVSEGITPKKGSVIITGRTPDLHQKTVKEMKEMDMPKVPIHHYPKDDLGDNKEDRDEKIGAFKAKKINELGIKKHYEDTKLQAKIIRKRTPAKVVEVKSGIIRKNG